MEGPSAIQKPSAMNGQVFRRDPSAKPCPQCKNASLCDITGHGYVLDIDVKQTLEDAKAQDDNGCYLCFLIWWSLKSRTAKIREMDDPVIALYCNPPFQGPIQQIDVIVVNRKKREDLGWALIDVGPPDGSEPPKLITTTPGQRGKYMALSYCWGQKPFFALTLTNKSELEQCIPFEQLSETIRDTIIITRRLDVRYVWIDSLCIIQGEEEEAVKDWEAQAQQMGTIFRNAFVTIAASSCGDAHQGLLCDRYNLSRSYYEFPADKEGREMVYLGRHGNAIEPHSVNESLHKRGWVFQESFLCVRSISYEKRELSWRCRTYQCREGLVESERLPLEASERDVPSNIRANWKSIVAEYSKKSLTYPDDRLPAIAGLAKIAQHGSPADYLYGIWMEQVAESLLWEHRGHSVDGKRVYTCQTKRRAPSWSWASVDGQIMFLAGADPKYIQAKVKGDGLLINGYLQKVKTIRLSTFGSYYGGYENFHPWMNLPTAMKTYLDSEDEVPVQHRLRRDENSPLELVNVWFLFLGPSSGLIIVEANDTESRPRGPLHSVYQTLVEDKKYVRLGAFVGYPIEKKWSSRVLLI
ncbi:hypothetical protein N0V84_002430 [Fusarium piperis]|uniref:Heterokaryon incompatibility domain-containing protein n=1 Tax=Fusarium piperis TaxID=1435070 RepID=A0A9W9BTE5_9HYPO|nr:hypothetical protein N0V84_002430 [Fusarium piperis]